LKILITGGLGYIGSHLALALILQGHEVIVYDMRIRGNEWRIENLNRLTGHPIQVIEGDINDESLLRHTLKSYQINLVYHLAGLKSVPESISMPDLYYQHNLKGSLTLIQAILDLKIPYLIFSSSSSVYALHHSKLAEQSVLNPQSPYGHAKQVIEKTLADLTVAHPGLHVMVLRYFNVAGAHSSGLLGENFLIEQNIFSGIMRVIYHIDPYLVLHGNQFPTPDGSSIRDFIHVMDLVEAHLACLTCIKSANYQILNLGSGKGVSLLELIQIFESLTQQNIPYQVQASGKGNAAYSIAENNKATKLLNWLPQHGVLDICRSHLFFSKNAITKGWLGQGKKYPSD
jgi:UDP-glucose 4-epimerase